MRYLFMFIVALGNIFLIQDFSLSFFLFNLLIFIIIFFPYSSVITNIGNFFLIPAIILVLSYLFMFGVSLIQKYEMDKKSSTSLMSKQKYPVKLALNKKKVTQASVAQQKKYLETRKILLGKTKISFTSSPIKWYKTYFKSIYTASINMVKFSLFGMYTLSLLLIVYTVFLLSSKMPIASCAYGCLAFLVLPMIFGINFQYFVQNIFKYELIKYSLFALVVLLSYLKLNRFKV